MSIKQKNIKSNRIVNPITMRFFVWHYVATIVLTTYYDSSSYSEVSIAFE